MTADLTFQRLTAAQARAHRDTVQDVHADAYAETLTDPFRAGSEFMRRFDTYTSREHFDFVFVLADGHIVGQAWGWPLPPDTAWWNGLDAEPEPSFTTETGTRTFALSEIMVRRAWTGRGIAHALHNELLRHRPEQRATLLVRPTNPAYPAYLRWGWHPVGRLRPDLPHAPTFDALILSLRNDDQEP
ncbi:acetyltransferase (GNAT) family protein [Actinocorallia herbida]|uniref:Acetyltransferase (GNAT) family protein n=1 Tax=Actinocorallia herbida TaxID=58109 RepID=A0A3N1CT16_9ACTN|nr:GNAT family N-acetyltransferase [Actinocorallia herbida]ROO84449.1 acetyltransferase (GNAT) family protein [Actinocorallia herbida]